MAAWKLENEVYSTPAPGEGGATNLLMFHQGYESRGKKRVITLHVLTGVQTSDSAIKWKTEKYIILDDDTPKEVIAAWKSALVKPYGIKSTHWQLWVDRKKVPLEEVERVRAEIAQERNPAPKAEAPKAEPPQDAAPPFKMPEETLPDPPSAQVAEPVTA